MSTTATMSRDELLARLEDVRARATRTAEMAARQDDITAELHSRERGLIEERRVFDASGVTGATRSGIAVVLFAVAVYALLIAVITHDVFTPVLLVVAAVVTMRNDPKRTTLGKLALVAGVLLTLVVAFTLLRSLMASNIVVDAILLGALAVSAMGGFVAYRLYLRHDATSVAAANVGIRLANEREIAYTIALRNEYDQLVGMLQQELQGLFAAAQGWFPPDYMSLPAIEFFAHAVRNQRADTMKEAVNQFVEHGYHVEQMDMLRSIRNQVMIGNILNIVQAGLQVRAINETRAAADRTLAGQRDIANSMREHTSAVRDHTKATNKANSTLRDIRRRL